MIMMVMTWAQAFVCSSPSFRRLLVGMHAASNTNRTVMSLRLATEVPHGPQTVGAKPPDVNVETLGINLKCINTGLTDDHLRIGNPYGYAFTQALVRDLKDVFGWQRAHGLFLAELGSQKLTAPIDSAFHKRAASATQGSHTTPPGHEDVAFLDKVTNLWEYLTQACGAAGLHELDVTARPPYAYIRNPNQLCVKPPHPPHVKLRFCLVKPNAECRLQSSVAQCQARWHASQRFQS